MQLKFINDLHCLGTQNFLSTGAGHTSGPPNSICSINKKNNIIDFYEKKLLLFVIVHKYTHTDIQCTHMHAI